MADRTIVAMFQDRDRAERAVGELRKGGFEKEISVLAKDEGQGRDDQGGTTMNADMGDLSSGATTGGALGGLAGLAVGAGALAIPGLGPLIAAGPIAGLLSGAATGGIAGGLIDWGIPEAEGRQYESDIKAGKVLVSVRTGENKIDQAAEILSRFGADSIKKH